MVRESKTFEGLNLLNKGGNFKSRRDVLSSFLLERDSSIQALQSLVLFYQVYITSLILMEGVTEKRLKMRDEGKNEEE